jgi:hypothetical protein
MYISERPFPLKVKGGERKRFVVIAPDSQIVSVRLLSVAGV